MSHVVIADTEIFYRRAGASQPSLLFVHGGFCDSRDWEKQFRDLADEFSVVAMDQRCHGQSSGDPASVSVQRFADDVHDLIDALDLGPTIIIGHSLGARVCIQAASDRPDHLLGAILVDGSRLTTGASMAEVRKTETSRFADDPSKYLAKRFRDMFFENADPKVRERVIETAVSTPAEKIRAVAGATGEWDAFGLEPALDAIPPELPLLAIQSTFGDEMTERYSLTDRDVTTPWLDRMKRYAPQLEVVITPNVGHFNMLEAADEVTFAIREFAHRHYDPSKGNKS